MKDKIVIDLRKMMDEFFNAAEDFSTNFQTSFKDEAHAPQGDFYPVYTYPPTNVYSNEEKALVFEMALAGFEEKDLSLNFQGDYMLFSAKGPEDNEEEEAKKRYIKHRLKLKAIEEQKYYVPADRFDRENADATFKNGLLTIVIPPLQEVVEDEGIKINIKGE